MMGPAYETEAELDMLAGFKADAVGMSTVQEVLMARFLGLLVTGFSVISNDRKERTDHNDVIKQADNSLKRLFVIIKQYIDYI